MKFNKPLFIFSILIILILIISLFFFSKKNTENYLKIKREPTPDDPRTYIDIPDDIINFAIYKEFLKPITPLELIQLYKLSPEGKRQANKLSMNLFGVNVPDIKNIFGIRMYTRRIYKTKLNFLQDLFNILGIKNTSTVTFKENQVMATRLYSDRKEKENLFESDSEEEDEDFKEVITTKIYTFGDLPHKIEIPPGFREGKYNFKKEIAKGNITSDLFIFFNIRKFPTDPEPESILQYIQIFIRKSSSMNVRDENKMFKQLVELVQKIDNYRKTSYTDPYFADVSFGTEELKDGYLFSFSFPVRIIPAQTLLNLRSEKYKDFQREIIDFINLISTYDQNIIDQFLSTLENNELKGIIKEDVIDNLRSSYYPLRKKEVDEMVEEIIKSNFTKNNIRRLKEILQDLNRQDTSNKIENFLNKIRTSSRDAIRIFISNLDEEKVESNIPRDIWESDLQTAILKVQYQDDPESIRYNIQELLNSGIDKNVYIRLTKKLEEIEEIEDMLKKVKD